MHEFKLAVLVIVTVVAFSFLLDLMININENTSLERETFSMVNEYRATRGLTKLDRDPTLCIIAKERVTEIRDDWSHNGFEKRIEDNSLYDEYCPNCLGVGENLVKVPAGITAFQAVTLWDASPKHNELLNDPTYDNGCFETDGKFGALVVADERN